MRKSPALAFSFQFTEKNQQQPTNQTQKQQQIKNTQSWEQNPCIYFTLAKSKECTLSLSLTQTISWNHYETVLEQFGVLKGFASQKEKEQGKKGYFQTTWSQLHYCYLYYHPNMDQPWSYRKHTKIFSRPHSGDKDESKLRVLLPWLLGYVHPPLKSSFHIFCFIQD